MINFMFIKNRIYLIRIMMVFVIYISVCQYSFAATQGSFIMNYMEIPTFSNSVNSLAVNNIHVDENIIIIAATSPSSKIIDDSEDPDSSFQSGGLKSGTIIINEDNEDDDKDSSHTPTVETTGSSGLRMIRIGPMTD